MRKLILTARSALLRSAVVATPLVIASACSESGTEYFTPTTGGAGGAMSGGSGGVGTGGTAGKGSGATGGASVSGAGGMTTGGTAGTGGVGSGGDAPIAGSAGTDAAGGTGGSDASGGEGGTGNEGGMDPTAGTAGSMGGDAGSGAVAGTSGTGGDPGTGGMAGTSGGAGAGKGGMGGMGGMGGTGGTGGIAGMAGTGGTGCVPKTEVCDGEDNDCGEDVDEGDVCPEGCHGATFGGRSFLLCTVSSGVEWDEALEVCQDLSTDSAVAVAGPMTLVQVDSAEENAFLIDWIVSQDIDAGVWLGANDLEAEGRWFWDRGTAAPVPFLTVINNNRTIIDGRYNDFPNGTFMPASGDCAHFDPAENFRWNDRACTGEYETFICGEIR